MKVDITRPYRSITQMDYYRLFAAIPFVIAGVALAISSITGKSINPLRGARPMIVARSEQPRRYWGAIVLITMFAGLSGWVASLAVLGY